MRIVDSVIGLGWLAFWLYWLASASGVKSGRSRWGRFVGVRLVIVLVLIVSFRVPALRGHSVHDQWAWGVGLGLFLLGLGLAIWARAHLGRNWGMPMTEKENPDLVTSGPYRWIRNPIYSGLILAMLGTAVAVTTAWLIVVVVLGGYFVYSAMMEQRFIAATFPDTYPAYRASTKMLIPFIF